MATPLKGQAAMQFLDGGIGDVQSLELKLDDGRKLSIEMIDDNEVGFVIHAPGYAVENEVIWSELLEETLHHPDCPMTNSTEEARTVCTCDALAIRLGLDGPRDTPVGGPHA